jgi:hypothetical protein
LIGRETNNLSLLQKHLNKLPQTKKLIEKDYETVEEFQIRRVKYVAEKLRECGELVEWKLIKEAGLRPGYSREVAKQIEKEIGIN